MVKRVSLSRGVQGVLSAANGGTGVNSLSGLALALAPHLSSGFTNIAVITATGNWTVPENVTRCKVTVIGGGAGGTTSAAGCGYWYCGTGGGGGGTSIKIVSGLVPGATVAVTVGAGGAPANAGGTSSFGVHCSATGGVAGGAGGAGSGGTLNIVGGYPLMGGGYRQGATNAAFGGSSFLSPMTRRGVTPGYGGGGAGGTDGVGVIGDAGGQGIVIIEY